MKRYLSWLAVLCLLLTACAPQQQEEPEETDLIVVGVSQVGSESGFRVANSESTRAVFTEEAGYHLLFEDARQKQENQISAIRRFTQQQVDYIVLMPIQETGWDSVLQEAKEAGIPVILVDRMVDVKDETLYTTHVGSDFRLEGERAVSWLEEHLQGVETPVNILHIRGTPGSSAQLGRTAALEEAVEAHESWTLAAQLDGDFIQAKTYEVVANYLGSQDTLPELHVAYCENENEAFGAIQALEEYGYTCGPGGVDIITFDATRQGLAWCLEGKITLDVECNPLLGPMVEQIIQAMEAGETPDKHYRAEERLFTRRDLSQAFIDQRAY